MRLHLVLRWPGLLAFAAACDGTEPAQPAQDSGASLMDGSLDAAADAAAPELPREAAQSGTRLEARWLTPADGEPMFLGMFDTEKGVACAFVPARDGVQRCLPTSAVGAQVYFDDAACAVPRLWMSRRCGDDAAADAGPTALTPAAYVTVLAAPACPVAYSVRRVTAYLDDGQNAAQLAPVASAGACLGSENEQAGLYARYDLAMEDDLASWLAGEELRTSSPGSHLEVRHVRGLDGSYVRLGARDKRLDMACAPQDVAGERAACEPVTEAAVWPAEYAADAACTKRVVGLTGLTCRDDSPYASPLDALCAKRAYYERGAATTPYYSGSGSCEPWDTSGQGAAPWYEAGGPVELGEFVALVPARASSPRLVLERWQDEHAQAVDPALPGRWYDNTLGEHCSAVEAADGTTRCLPGARFDDLIYEDAACKRALGVRFLCSTSAHGYRFDTDLDCDGAARAYEFGDAVQAPVEAYLLRDGTCEPASATPGAEYRTLREVLLAQFALVEARPRAREQNIAP